MSGRDGASGERDESRGCIDQRRGERPAAGHERKARTSRRAAGVIALALAVVALAGEARATPPTMTTPTLVERKPVFRGTSLAEQRRRAVRRGLRWLHWYVTRNWNASAIGIDAVCLFREIAANSADESVRRRSYAIARRLALRLKAFLLRKGRLNSADRVLEALDLLGLARFLSIDPQPLLDRVRKRFPRYSTPRALFGVDVGRLGALDGDQLFDLLIETYTTDRSRFLVDPKLATSFHLGLLVPVLRKRGYVDFDKDSSKDAERFYTDAYLATHVAYVLSDYSVVRLSPSLVAPEYAFMRRNFASMLKEESLEVVAEFVDVYRTMGFSELDDSQVSAGTRFLLRKQAKDGSWGPWRSEKSKYYALHYTWVAVHALRDRTLHSETPVFRYFQRLLRGGALTGTPIKTR